MNTKFSIEGNIIDVVGNRIFKGKVVVGGGKIVDIVEASIASEQYIAPGLIDAHVHIESSMLVPVEFSKLAIKHGVTSVVTDPHEIANVLGIKGVEFMIQNAKYSPLKFYFGAPSCVPANPKESSGACIGVAQTKQLLQNENIFYLSEMMNFPGVVYEDKEVIEKIKIAKSLNKPIDGHAPLLNGEMLKKYVNAGISTDHECVTIDEAREKISLEMKILIREGSAAKNLTALIDLIDTNPESIMFCTDDSHPNDLLDGYINKIVQKSIGLGKNVIDVFKACTLNPVMHYNLKSGLLRINDPADFIVFDNLYSIDIHQTYIDGNLVFDGTSLNIKSEEFELLNVFNAKTLSIDDICVRFTDKNVKVLEAINGELLTGYLSLQLRNSNGFILSDIETDILKIIVVDRYSTEKKLFVGFIHNFGLKNGAIASSVSHDNHNIVAIGVNDFDIVQAINLVITAKGGISFYSESNFEILPLPVGGIMSTLNGKNVSDKYLRIDKLIKESGCNLTSPIMTLSFMALSVIPNLKITPQGLFDVKKFDFVPLFDE